MNNINEYNLHELAKNDKYETLEKVLNAVSTEQKPSFLNKLDKAKGWSPLHYAVDQGNFKIVWLLLQHKANYNLPDKSSNTPLHNLLLELRITPVSHTTMQCLYTFLLSGIDVKRLFLQTELYTTITSSFYAPSSLHPSDFIYDFAYTHTTTEEPINDRQRNEVHKRLIQAEDFIAQAKKGFGLFGREVVHGYILSSEPEQEAFATESFQFKGKIYQHNKANAGHSGKSWPVELSTLVFKELLNSSSAFFKPKINPTSHHPNETSDMSRLAL